jgi:hypothetical protein
LTANYKIFQAIVENSGFGWDEENKLNTAPDNVWEDYIEVSIFSHIALIRKMHPKAAEYQYESLPLYDELHEIFGTGSPPGRRAASTIPKKVVGNAVLVFPFNCSSDRKCPIKA